MTLDRGFDAQVNGATISVPAVRRGFGCIFEGETVLPATWQTAPNAISTLGQILEDFLCSYLSDLFGRKKSLLVGVVLCAGGIFGQLFSSTRIAFLCSKLVLGFGLGFYLTIDPLCISEFAPVVFRGIMDVVPTARAKWVQPAITVVSAFVYFMTTGAMAFAILGDTSVTSLRAHTAALATATQAILGLATNFAIPNMVNPVEANLKGKVDFILGGLGMLGAIWARFFIRAHDEIDRMFSDRIPLRKMGSYILI